MEQRSALAFVLPLFCQDRSIMSQMHFTAFSLSELPTSYCHELIDYPDRIIGPPTPIRRQGNAQRTRK